MENPGGTFIHGSLRGSLFLQGGACRPASGASACVRGAGRLRISATRLLCVPRIRSGLLGQRAEFGVADDDRHQILVVQILSRQALHLGGGDGPDAADVLLDDLVAVAAEQVLVFCCTLNLPSVSHTTVSITFPFSLSNTTYTVGSCK